MTCPVGIHMVGYTMICFGVCGSFSSFVGGKLEKHVGSVTLISAGKQGFNHYLELGFIML